MIYFLVKDLPLNSEYCVLACRLTNSKSCYKFESSSKGRHSFLYRQFETTVFIGFDDEKIRELSFV